MNQLVKNDSIKGMATITKHDTELVDTRYSQGLMVTGAGNVNIEFIDNTTAIIAFAAGDILKCDFIRIKATSTTATGIAGLRLKI